MNKTKMSRAELLEAAHKQLDHVFNNLFTDKLTEITVTQIRMEHVYDAENLGLFRMIWDIVVETKSEIDDENLKQRQHETMIRILKEEGYRLGEVEYQEGYQPSYMVDAVIYPDGEYEIYSSNDKRLPLDEQWDLAWRHYHSH